MNSVAREVFGHIEHIEMRLPKINPELPIKTKMQVFIQTEIISAPECSRLQHKVASFHPMKAKTAGLSYDRDEESSTLINVVSISRDYVHFRKHREMADNPLDGRIGPKYVVRVKPADNIPASHFKASIDSLCRARVFSLDECAWKSRGDFRCRVCGHPIQHNVFDIPMRLRVNRAKALFKVFAMISTRRNHRNAH